jgi:hypothetical protein
LLLGSVPVYVSFPSPSNERVGVRFAFIWSLPHGTRLFWSFLGIVNVACMIRGASKRNIVGLPAFTLTLVIRSVISWCDVDGLGFDVCFDV